MTCEHGLDDECTFHWDLMPLRCGRLDDHDAHEWTSPKYRATRTYHCTGRVITTLAEREWADRADFDDKGDDELREWLRDAWAS